MTGKRLFFVTVFLWLIAIGSIAQSPWVRENKEIYAQLSYNTIPEYNRLFLKNGDIFTTSRLLKDKTLQAYFEYGITTKTTVVVNLPYKMIDAGASVLETDIPLSTEKGSLNGFGNIQFALKQQVHKNSYVVSAQLKVELPTVQSDENTGLRTGYDSWSIIPMLSIGKSGEKYFTYAYLGTAFRTNNYSNYLNSGIEFGYVIYNKFWIIGFVDVIESFEDKSKLESSENLQTGFYLNNQEYLAYGAKFILEVKSREFGIVGAFGGAFTGHLVSHSPSLNIGAFWKISKK